MLIAKWIGNVRSSLVTFCSEKESAVVRNSENSHSIFGLEENNIKISLLYSLIKKVFFFFNLNLMVALSKT